MQGQDFREEVGIEHGVMHRLPAHERPLQNVLAERAETAGIVARKGGKREPPGVLALGDLCQLAGLIDLHGSEASPRGTLFGAS
jgi:hypothetical protein